MAQLADELFIATGSISKCENPELICWLCYADEARPNKAKTAVLSRFCKIMTFTMCFSMKGVVVHVNL